MTMPNLHIRPSVEKEFAKLAEIFVLSFLKGSLDPKQMEKVAQRFRAEIRNNILYFQVAEEKGQIIGLGGEARHMGSSYLGAFGVIPARRKRGIGSMLIRRLLDQALAHNPTVELFGNIGLAHLYRRFGFEDEFHVHLFELTNSEKANPDVKIASASIPKWVYELDQKTMDFDRSQFLKYLVETLGASLVYLKQDGYAMCVDSRIGPLIAKDVDVAKSLVNHLLLTGSKQIISPDEFESVLKPFSPKRIQTNVKMKYGNPLSTDFSRVWGYHRFTTS